MYRCSTAAYKLTWAADSFIRTPFSARLDMPYFPVFTAVLFLSFFTIPYTFAASNSSKAGLAWPNGNWDDIEQYTSTGKVSWFVPSPSNWAWTDPLLQVLHMEPKLDQLEPGVCADALG